MSDGPRTAAGRHRRRYRRALAAGLAASVLLHGAVLLGWRADRLPPGATTAAGPRSGDALAAAGSGALQALAVSVPPRIEIPSPPAPLPVLDAPEIEFREPVESPSLALGKLDGGRSAAGPPGLAGATGRGDGGADAAGRRRNTVPEPRVIVPDWDAPRALKGMRVRLRVLVDERGRAVDVVLDPPTPDDGFNRRLIDTALGMDFRPALRDGRPVRDWAVITRVF
ncbi:MAG: energy transducer TonB [Gemmatimonadota bacterium]|nr:energy transducer TonB [Gemmatimonadota bacterium]